MNTKVATLPSGETNTVAAIKLPAPSVPVAETGDEIWDSLLADTPDCALDKMIAEVETNITQRKIKPVERTTRA